MSPRPLLCRWGWHRWSEWVTPYGWRLLEERKCQRWGCTAREHRDAKTGEPR